MWNITYTHGGMKFWWLTLLPYFFLNMFRVITIIALAQMLFNDNGGD
jgi:hypothetical protein